jgi:uncharacterized membrane protein YbaN (DUF454 family)
MAGQTKEVELSPQIEPISAARRIVYLVLAGVFFLLGAIGVILPGLPTTPFLLLTSYLLIRTSPGLNSRLLNSRWFGPVLRDWQLKGGVRRMVKGQALGVIVVFVPLTLWFAPVATWIKVSIGVLTLVGIAVVIRLPVIDE